MTNHYLFSKLKITNKRKKELNMNNREIADKLEEFTEDHELNHNNSFVDVESDDRIIMNIEAPNHTTLQIDFFDTLLEELRENFTETLHREVRRCIEDFDVNERFDDLYSPNFEFEPLEFMEMLKEDKEYFNEVLNELK